MEVQQVPEVQHPETFVQFLEQSGVADQIAKILIDLYEKPEKTEEAAKFIQARFGCDTEVKIEDLIIEMDRLKDENAQLRKDVEDLQKELETLKPTDLY